MGKNRIEAFSDGVFAIAITLLVLDIKIPELQDGNLIDVLAHLLPNILAYILSFIIIGVYWVAHHSMMHFVKIIDRNALWLNNLTLLTIAFMPFPTSLLSKHYSDPLAIFVYCATLSTCNCTGSLFWFYISKNKRFVDENLSKKFIKEVFILHLLPILVYSLATIVSFYFIKLSFILIASIPAFFILPNPFLNKIFNSSHETKAKADGKT